MGNAGVGLRAQGTNLHLCGGIPLTLKIRRCLHGPKKKEMLTWAYVCTQGGRRAYPTRGGLEGVCVKGASRLPCAYLGSLNLFKQDCIYIFLV